MEQYDLKIINARIIVENDILDGASLYVAGGKIALIDKVDHAANQVLDTGGNYLSPGFIDIHVHGGAGYDFMDNTLEAYLEIAKLHARYGTTAFTPTTLSCEHESLMRTLELYEQAEPLNTDGARFLGMHIEGPYFSMEQRGAQDPRFIRLPDPAEYKVILDRSSIVKRWSAAPELDGAIEFGKYLKDKGVLGSIAHTDAIYEDVVEAYTNGFTHMTHFYSCMSGVSRRNAFRYAGVVEAGYLIDDMTVEIIADGRHLPPALLKLVYKIKGADKIALVTDAMRAAGMPPGESVLGRLDDGLKVIIEDGVAKLPDRTAFAGSVATAIDLVKNMVQLAEVPLTDAIIMMTATPARIMKAYDSMGSIATGKLADLVIFDDDFNLSTTIIGGKVVYADLKD
ncbi:N-acetylglucosamine-6-phosphate deacetylase [Mucilaginibacter conchicola]|uniref:N-acetylglucosamine-6-phosphate deacetylase n=1 Tax=Mucilaginibacter conchicola TaxID=2303333 RepID=A0A372NQV4_9SPHI|nr:N-acetylglucosamine-6-phosphate deacetylase [Mucilaginibacter conchicola]RFZ90987.1 N-acetylglucosamine-6-phosphate deacetylase [Mucilaginibacter conchicola]